MKRQSVILVLSIFYFNLLGQNRIANSSFEFIKPGESSDLPNLEGQADKIEAWYSQRNCWKKITYNSPWTDVNCDITDVNWYDYVRLHSPDWFSLPEYPSASSLYPLVVPPSYGQLGGFVPPNSGSKFVGMAQGELIQQRLYDGQKLTPGVTYYLSFYIQLFHQAHYIADDGLLGTGPPHVDARIKALAGAKRINYLNNGGDDTCYDIQGNYLSKKETEGGIQDIVSLGAVGLSSLEFPYREWHQVSIQFVAPENYGLDNHDWIAIELQDWGEDMCKAYIGIDDVKLMECPPTESCSITYGEIWPSFTENHYSDQPWRVGNISNAERLDVEIWPMNGGEVVEFSVSCQLGFPNGWEWNGRNAGGAELANATYMYKVITRNQCGPSTHTGMFVKANASNNPTDYTDLSNGCAEVSYVPPKLCCEHEPTLYLDDHHWVDQNLLFHATTEIIVASVAPVTVGSNSNVIMRAGERIELNPGFSSDNAEYFLAEIVPCGGSGAAQRLADIENQEQNSEAVLVASIAEFNLYPNPNSGSFTITGSGLNQVIIIDATGKLVRQINGGSATALQVDGLGAGLYLVRAQMVDGSVESAKVVVN